MGIGKLTRLFEASKIVLKRQRGVNYFQRIVIVSLTKVMDHQGINDWPRYVQTNERPTRSLAGEPSQKENAPYATATFKHEVHHVLPERLRTGFDSGNRSVDIEGV